MAHKRRYSRLPIRTEAKIQCSKGIFCRGYTLNISFGGVLVAHDNGSALAAGETCALFLDVENQGKIVTMEFRSRVIYSLAAGTGLEFCSINPASYGYLVYLMARNTPDPDELFDELARNPMRLSESL